MDNPKNLIVKRVIQILINFCLDKNYVLIHRGAYKELLKRHQCKCGGKCKGEK